MYLIVLKLMYLVGLKKTSLRQATKWYNWHSDRFNCTKLNCEIRIQSSRFKTRHMYHPS